MSFFAGILVGALGTYAYLLYACQRAAERFEEAIREELDRS